MPESLASQIAWNSTEKRALELLGTGGVSQEQVAAALGVTASYISQLMSQEEFAEAVTSARFIALQSHSERDSRYDKVEDALLEKLETTLPLMHKPLEIARTLQIINGAKRRGAGSPDAGVQKQTVITLVLPTQIIDRFSSKTNLSNQVLEVNGQQLLTIQSSTLLDISKESRVAKGETHEQQSIARTSQSP